MLNNSDKDKENLWKFYRTDAWLIFIDDLRDLLAEAGGELFMYADDVCIAFQGPDLSQQYARAQRALDILRPWALENSVEVPLDKTSATAFSPGRRLSKENKAKAACPFDARARRP